MFDYTLAHWGAFFVAALLLNLTPGPDMIYVLSHTARGGKRAGLAAMFGVWSGAFCHILFAAAGLSAIILASGIAFNIIKWFGAAYLIWLGIQAFRSNGSVMSSQQNMPRLSEPKIYRQGIFVSLLNPKVAIFFLAFLPQFIVQGAGPIWGQLFLHGTLILFVAAFIEIPLVFLGAKIRSFLIQKPHFSLWMDRLLGSLFIGLGLRLALSTPNSG
jgi:threonine/homoserine/homoserine lactone efflux protein